MDIRQVSFPQPALAGWLFLAVSDQHKCYIPVDHSVC